MAGCSRIAGRQLWEQLDMRARIMDRDGVAGVKAGREGSAKSG